MTSSPTEPPAEAPGPLGRFRALRWQAVVNWLGPLLALACVYGFFLLLAPSTFATFDVLQTVLRQTVIVGTAAVGMTLVIVSAGLDLSIGSSIALVTVVVARVLQGVAGDGGAWTPWLGPLAVVLAVLLAVAAGASLKSFVGTGSWAAMVPPVASGGLAALVVTGPSGLAGDATPRTLPLLGVVPAGTLLWAAVYALLVAATAGGLVVVHRRQGAPRALVLAATAALAVGLGCVVRPLVGAAGPWAAPLALLTGVATGALAGLLNALVVTHAKVVPFIVTLGTLLAFRGVAKGVAEQGTVIAPGTWINDLAARLDDSTRWILVPPAVWITVLLALFTTGLPAYTRLGRHIYAVGSNEQTARLCGVAVEHVKLAVYTMSGALVGVAGVLKFSQLTVGDPTTAETLELDAIAAVVIGGGSLTGGEGSVFGTLVGALIMVVIRSGCTHMGLSDWVQDVLTGAVIVIAVWVDRLRHRRPA